MIKTFTRFVNKKLFLLALSLLMVSSVSAQIPTITSFSPASGPAATTVTITGTGFNAAAANNVVFFGATRAAVSVASTTRLTVTVPFGATYQPITVLNSATQLQGASAKPFITTFTPNKGTITAQDISPKVDFTTGTNPVSVAIGDLDGDGKPDLAVANYNSTTVSVYRNTSASGSIAAGSFAAKVNFATGGFPSSVAIGDLNGDGKPELAVANQTSNTVSVYRNTSVSGSITAGSFAAKVDFETGLNPISVAIGDLDGDGKPDLAVANGGSLNGIFTVSVLRNTSASGSIAASSFAANVDFTAGATPSSVAIGDLDGDGKPDLAVANSTSKTVSVLRNTSVSGSIVASSFSPRVDFATETFPHSVAIGDLDGDGKPDLAVANGFNNTVSVYRNTSTSGSIAAASFAAKVDFATATNPRSVAIGDLDGDGKPDLATANTNSSSSVSVLRNTSASGSIGAGSFAAKVDFATGNEPYSLAIGDLDCDGKSDLAIANSSSSTVSVLRYNPVFPPAITSFSPASGQAGTTVTITGTGFNATAANNIVFFGATQAAVSVAGTTSLTVTVPKGATYQPITVLNSATQLQGTSAKPFITTFTPNKSSITAQDISSKVDFTTGTNPISVAIGDLDGDGKPDLAVVNNGSNTVSVLRNTSATGSIAAGSFAAKVDFATGTSPRSVAIGDLDGDGKPDLAVVNNGSNTVSVYRNSSATGSIAAGSFAAKVDFATGTSPRSVAIGDLDGDGKPDLAVTNSISYTVSVYRNTSVSGSITAGSFAAKVDFMTGTEPVSVAIGDLDGDGKPDLAVANVGSGINTYTVSVLRNTSATGSIAAGSFAAKVDLATGLNPISVAIGDLDGDGKPDLAVANFSSRTVSVLRNTSASGSIVAGSFAAKVDFATGTAPRSVTIGDLDGDGKPDLAVANDASNTVSVLRNTSASGSIAAGSFAAKVDFATGGGSGSVAIGDLDGDGKPDLATANYNSSTVSILRNNPVLPPAITLFSPASGPVETTVTITGTGFNATAANNVVFFGATQATVSAASATSLTVTVPKGATYQPITVLNSATQLQGASAKPFIATFTPNKGTITAQDISPKVDFATGTYPRSVAIGDLDGDGKPDLALANSGSNTVSVYRNTSASGSIAAGSFAAKVDFATGTSPESVAIGDLDGDGKPDLAVANANSSTVSVYRNTSASGSIAAGSFAAKVDFATGTSPYSVAIGDLDGDGKIDLATANLGTHTVSVLRNTSSSGSIAAGSFAAKVDFMTGSGPYSVSIGDLDGDGKHDLATANLNSSTISVLRNTSAGGSITAGSFAAKVDFETGTNPISVAIGDLSGDGKPDLTTANSRSNTVSVLHNTSASGSIAASSFAAKVDLTTGANPRNVAIGDLDGDGKPDLAVVNYESNTVSVLRNNPVLAPAITSFASTAGTQSGNNITNQPIAGGTTITITGTNFVAPMSISTGETVTVVSATSATYTLAAGTGGQTITPVVTTAAGTSAASATITYALSTDAALSTLTSTAGAFTPSFAPATLNYSASVPYATTDVTITPGSNNANATIKVNNVTVVSGSASAAIPLNAGTNTITIIVTAQDSTTTKTYELTITRQIPVINASTNTLAALSTTYGTASASGTFNVSGTGLTAGILVTPPVGFEVSTNNTTFTNTITIGTAGDVSSTPVYLRLEAVAPVNTYSGNVTLTSASAPAVAIAVNGTLSAATLDVTAVDYSKIYDGTAYSGGNGVNYNGFVNNQDTSVLSGTLTYTGSAQGANNAGTYVITPAGLSAPNYTLHYNNGTLTISRQNITAITKPAAISAAFGTAFTGLTLPATVAVTFSNGKTGNLSVTWLAGNYNGNAAGTYTLTGNFTTDANTSNTPTLTASIDVIVGSKNITAIAAQVPVAVDYATTAATLTAQYLPATVNVTYNNGSNESLPVTWGTANYDGNKAGLYTLTGNITLAPGTTNSGNLTAGINVTVNKGTALITADAVQSYVYNGTARSVNAALNHSETSLSYSPQQSYTEVGSYPVTIIAAATANYNGTTKNVTLQINPATITGLTLTDASFIYDGTAKSLSVIGLPAGATVTYTDNGQITVGTYNVTATVKRDNYSDQVLNAKLTITPATITGVTLADQSFVYDGSAKSLAVTGLPDGATVTYTGNNQNTVGTYNVTATIKQTNYNDLILTSKLNITPATITGVTLADQNFIYDGTAKSLAVTGLPTGATVAFTGDGQTNVGTYNVTATVKQANYNDLVLNGKLTIIPATITGVTLADQSFIYDGSAKNLSVINLPADATVTYTGNGLTTVGTYDVTATVKQANYNDLTLTSKLTITPATITGVTLADQSFVYDGTAKSLALTGLPTGATVTYTGNGQTAVGTYNVTATVKRANYNDQVIEAKLTITPATTTGVTLADASFIYDGKPKSLAVTGLPTGSTVAYTGNSQINANSYIVTAKISRPNYSDITLSANLTVSKANLIITADNQTKVYGQANPELTVSYSGFVTGESPAILSKAALATTTANTSSLVGNYPITVSGAVASNYIINYINGTLAITSASNRTITFNGPIVKTYGDADFNAGGRVSSGEPVIYSSANTSVATIVNGNIHIVGAGSTVITATAAANTNYTGTPAVSQTLTVDKATQRINFTSIPDQIRESDFDLGGVTASSGLPVTFTTSNPQVAVIQGQRLRALSIGSARITASQAGNANYYPAATEVQALTVLDAQGNQVIVHQAVSPNGDGMNDYLYLEGVQNYPNNRVTVVNRNGVKVFEVTGYDNADRKFEGRSNVNGQLQQPGTYFYQIQYVKDGKGTTKNGWFVLKY
jgi:gliding motility-associated-like protein